MKATLTLSENSRLRFLCGATLYFAQGIPYGLLSIAIPAWLASQNVSAADIASYLAVVILPWVFKLIFGPFMDRYGVPSMGRKRPWVLLAQLGLSATLFSLMLIDDPIKQINELIMLGLLINLFAASQDVATDGMSIDLTPVKEQGRLNAFMSFGKAIGWSLTAAVTGTLLVSFGMAVTAIVAGACSMVIFLLFLLVRERPGEKVLPWSSGKTAAKSGAKVTFSSVFSGVNNVLWKRASLFTIAVMIIDGFISGYGSVLMPIAAVKVFGFTTPQWTQIVAVMGMVGAGVTLAMGPMIDRFGPRRMMIVTSFMVAVHALLLAQTQFLWNDTLYVKTMLSVWVLMQPVTMVCVIALAMTICSSKCSATQFAIYMSVANLGASAGSKFYGITAEFSNYAQSYSFIAIMTTGLLFVLFLYRQNRSEPSETQKKRIRRYTIVSNAAQGGLFMSGAMRCPKCRSDMELININGTEVDRCTECSGIWFDAGEVEAMLASGAAAEIDTATTKLSKEFNKIEDYDCTRCGGQMLKRYDHQQPHIWYETCAVCHGSFFDAGEFLDLSENTLGDFFKNMVTPKRTNDDN